MVFILAHAKLYKIFLRFSLIKNVENTELHTVRKKSAKILKIQWLFTHGVEWNPYEYIVEISTIYGFHSTINIHWIFQFSQIFFFQCIPLPPPPSSSQLLMFQCQRNQWWKIAMKIKNKIILHRTIYFLIFWWRFSPFSSTEIEKKLFLRKKKRKIKRWSANKKNGGNMVL